MNPTIPNLAMQNALSSLDAFSDARTQGYQGPSRYVRLGRVTPNGTAAIAKSEDGVRCAVAGKESLRIIRISQPGRDITQEHKSAVGPGGHRIDSSRNFWDGSGLKIDSTSTDVAWGYGLFNNKILTSARNGELIMWDLNRNGAKYERRCKDHIRSINKLSVSHVAHYYCITGSADGDMRIWDLRDFTKSVIRVRHPTSIRSLVFSPSVWQPLQAIVGLDNGGIYRWDLKMGQRGGLDRLAVAHSAPVTTLDWCSSTIATTVGSPAPQQDPGNGLGWLVSGGLDRCVKVWDLTAPSASSHIPNRPTYILHPSFPVRRVAWRPGYECELAVVSNDEISVPALDQPLSSATSVPAGLLSRVGSGLDLDSMLKGFTSESYPGVTKEKLVETLSGEPLRSPGQSGDTLEIWDVRREWIGKWTVSRASVDGGIADIAFSDSHALWAQYSSGTFSQLDLREATKPIASISRVASTWDVAGSLTFVSNKPSRFDPPYDDLQHLERGSDTPKSALKGLGDPIIKLRTQAFSTFITEDAIEDLESFTYLARNYRFQGSSKSELCELNSEVALQADCVRESQTWRLMAATFSDFVPPIPPPPVRSPRDFRKPLPPGQFPTAPNNYTFPPAANVSNDLSNKWSPGRRSMPFSHASQLRSRSPSVGRHLTPSSSNSSSPRHISIGLPVTPNRTTMFGRRPSTDSGLPGSRQPSAFRRASMAPFTHSNSASPSERASSSLRHVGEGALDDSSSSSDEHNDTGHETVAAHSEDDEASRPLLSPASLPGKQLTAPSPLSRIAGQHQWSEEDDEDDDAPAEKDDADSDEASSPSPRSTDTESDGSSSSRREAKSRSSRRTSLRFKTRSRSSTIASLAAPPRLVHQDSRSSIRTVTAAEATGAKEPPEDANAKQTASHLDDNTPILNAINNHRRHKSQSYEHRQDHESVAEEKTASDAPHPTVLSQRRIEAIRADEKRFRDMAWSALRKALEDHTDEGDVQMSAMICLIAQEELKLPVIKAIRILEAYLERLMRLRLYTCAAFIRKYSNLEALRSQSLVETVIYTTCARCHKPTMRPAAPPASSSAPARGAFAFCLGCRATTVVCAICHLPVRALLFHCSVCNHGGHQSCYRRYYMEHPMSDLPTSFLPPSSSEDRGRSISRTFISPPLGTASASTSAAPSTENDDTFSVMSTQGSVMATSNPSPSMTERSITQKIMGHLCATGCGHYCWAANMVQDTTTSDI